VILLAKEGSSKKMERKKKRKREKGRKKGARIEKQKS
jgi:hypothetical protein